MKFTALNNETEGFYLKMITASCKLSSKYILAYTLLCAFHFIVAIHFSTIKILINPKDTKYLSFKLTSQSNMLLKIYNDVFFIKPVV